MDKTSGTKRRWGDIIVSTVFGILVATGVFMAQLPEIPSPFDGNGDDRIDFPEFRTFMASLFEHGDFNGDGVIDKAELSDLVSDLRPSLAQSITLTFRIIELDQERDGTLSKAEFLNPTALESVFKQFDKNSDGHLTRGEGKEVAFDILFPN